jgi:hypothetical protein
MARGAARGCVDTAAGLLAALSGNNAWVPLRRGGAGNLNLVSDEAPAKRLRHTENMAEPSIPRGWQMGARGMRCSLRATSTEKSSVDLTAIECQSTFGW